VVGAYRNGGLNNCGVAHDDGQQRAYGDAGYAADFEGELGDTVL
jgi:hypothetical protein